MAGVSAMPNRDDVIRDLNDLCDVYEVEGVPIEQTALLRDALTLLRETWRAAFRWSEQILAEGPPRLVEAYIGPLKVGYIYMVPDAGWACSPRHPEFWPPHPHPLTTTVFDTENAAKEAFELHIAERLAAPLPPLPKEDETR